MRPRVYLLTGAPAAFLEECFEDCVARGEAPLVTSWHRESNFRWLAVCDLVAFYIDRGFAAEERALLTEAVRIQTPIELRRLDGKPVPGFIWMHRNDVPHAPCPICTGPKVTLKKAVKP